MPDSGFLALFLVGLLGGGHCVGMCGGIVGALSMGGGGRFSLHLAYNAGRIASYGAAGALAGLLGGGFDRARFEALLFALAAVRKPAAMAAKEVEGVAPLPASVRERLQAMANAAMAAG